MSGPGDGPAAVTAALQAVLAGEHAVVYAYGVVGARSAPGLRPAALAALAAHEDARDRLTTLLRGRGASPVGAAAAYPLPFPVAGPADAVRLAVTVESRLAVDYDALLGTAGEAALRRLALAGLAAAAEQATRWRLRGGLRPATVPLPGRD